VSVPRFGFNKSLLNKREDVNDKIKAPNKQETSAAGGNSLKAGLEAIFSPMIPIFLIHTEKLSRDGKKSELFR